MNEFTYQDILDLKPIPRENLTPEEVRAVTKTQLYVRNQACSPSTYAVIELIREHLHYNIIGLADLIKLAPRIEKLSVSDHSRESELPS